MISSELVPFFESGVSIGVATRDADGMPDVVRGLGAYVHADRLHLTLFVPAAVAETTLSNLLRNDRVAATFSRPTDHRTLQIKGRRVALRQVEGAEQERIEAYLPRLAEALCLLGMPPRITRRLAHGPAWAIDVLVESLFDATPGPGAGTALVRR
ncbi:pyridoxamine 5'-phosphate oxidase family protein [Vulgatibacter sp.]|uniref:pyridoxamine 5'-phosphate oxidase family protein n=1 Tax=Vulgatibacter sp. TaxID=1971226 RepID=UPI003565FB99